MTPSQPTRKKRIHDTANLDSQKESDEAEILKIGADVNGKVKGELNDGFTPLHLAASFNQSEIVKILVSSGADETRRVIMLERR